MGNDFLHVCLSLVPSLPSLKTQDGTAFPLLGIYRPKR